MKLIIILIALAVERFANVELALKRFNWFSSYLSFLKKIFEKSGLWQGIAGLILVVVPILIIVAIVYYLLAGWVYGFIGFLLALAILIYCLGPQDLFADTAEYLKAIKNGADPTEYLSKFTNKPSSSASNIKREITKAIFRLYNETIFATLFWFVILGPLGAVLYRTVILTKQISHQEETQFATLAQASQWFTDVLDWIPLRLLGIGYALTGHFIPTFSFWLHNVLSGFDKNHQFAEDIGLIALDANEEVTKADINENKEAFELIYRTIIVFLVVLALIVIGSLL